MKLARHVMTLDEERMHYSVVGQGEPLVLVHGLSGSWRWWLRNVPTLAQHYRVYLVDLPGFGSMRHLSKKFDLLRCAAWLDMWMKELGLEEVRLVGHSMGGYICMELAALRPEKVKHLVLVDSIGIPFGPMVSQLEAMAMRSIYRTTPAFWPYMAYDYLRAGRAMVQRAAEQIISLDAASVISSVAAPTLLVWGDQDDLVPLSLGQQLHANLTGSRLLILEGSNHFSMFDQPRVFNSALLAFFQGEEIGDFYQGQSGDISLL
ncbi:dihydrolipoamide acetyltransferase [Ktedonobacter sp. SOSP1-85]|uniref:alpha/beta fold hydrolase n=1 Tax=Ktedonobacter sp. SOSP1-85 TaxID=2778367 RepID=UPI0019157692|nr:alpha/beta hydrolase [Ktedonobacter sp. SOSP1-85]GHO80340.1 dihydrolipoamide acetyltransferase [Ktedonobacter sp. SOSP1-85]